MSEPSSLFSDLRQKAERHLVYPLNRDECLALVAVAEAAQDLYERVEMDESVGVCLSDRVPSLRLGDALRDEAIRG